MLRITCNCGKKEPQSFSSSQLNRERFFLERVSLSHCHGFNYQENTLKPSLVQGTCPPACSTSRSWEVEALPCGLNVFPGQGVTDLQIAQRGSGQVAQCSQCRLLCQGPRLVALHSPQALTTPATPASGELVPPYSHVHPIHPTQTRN